MTTEALKYVNDCIEELSIPYEFMEWTQGLSFPYFIGEYTDIQPMNEDGRCESTFILTGTTNQSYLTLETIKEMVKDYFTDTGKTAILDSGSGIAVSFSTSFPVSTGKTGLRRIQINLNIQEWRI